MIILDIKRKINEGYNHNSLFRMLYKGFLIDENKSFNISEKINLKKEQYKAFFTSLTRPNFGSFKRAEASPINISSEDIILLFFNSSIESKKLAIANGISEEHSNLFLSFDDYCDELESLFKKHQEMNEQFNEIFYQCFVISYTYFELLVFEDLGNEISNNKKIMNVESIKKLIRDFEKQQKGKASEKKKNERKSKLYDAIGFEEGDLSFDDQIKFYKSLTTENNEKRYVLQFLRNYLINLLASIKIKSSKRNFLIDLSYLIPYLNPEQLLLKIDKIDDMIGYIDEKDYRSKISKRFFNNLKMCEL